MPRYNKDELKNNLTIEQVSDFVAELGGEPQMVNGNILIAQTICHNKPGNGSHKLYYYDNTKLFKCYTDCGCTFDIFGLVQRSKNEELPQAVFEVASFFNFSPESNEIDYKSLEDWKILENYERLNEQKEEEKKIVEMKFYDESILTHLPLPYIVPWLEEGITYDVMKERGIKFEYSNYVIIIPHYDINNNLVGIRQRTLVKEDEIYGKYRPAYLHYQLYNHPLGFNLYNINNSKNAIKSLKKAIVFEGEKSCLLYASYFGVENDISVACCGSSLISYQVELLLSLGVEEIIVAFDKQFQEIGDKEWVSWTKKLNEINNKYSKLVNVSFLFDKWEMLGYKDSPIDKGKETFLELFKRRSTV